MPRFFTELIANGQAVITGEDARHITKVLRMTPGEAITVCDGKENDYCGSILSVGEEVVVSVSQAVRSEAEPNLRLHLFQALPKGEKMEFIIQKAVELGAYDITPVLSSRCVSRPDAKSMEKKLSRYNKIAQEAAKQCGRGIIPVVHPLICFEQALATMAAGGIPILCYECGGEPLQKIIVSDAAEISLMVGSEGGFSEEEAVKAQKCGVRHATLGKRILRCETAPVAAISIVMNLTGNM